MKPNGLCLEFKASGPWFLCDLSSPKVSVLIEVPYMHSPYPGARKVVGKGEEEKKRIKYLTLPCVDKIRICATLVVTQNNFQSRHRQYNLKLNKARMGKELVLVKPVRF